MKEKVGFCEVCFNLAEGPRCTICLDERRDESVLCVVEEPGDVIPVERTHEFRGRYHVLGGALSPIDGVDPENLRIEELYARVSAAPVTEVVLATNPTTTGEATALHIARGPARALRRRHRDPPGERPAGRLRPRVRRRGDARPGDARPRARSDPAARRLRILHRSHEPWARIVMKFGGTSVADADKT